MKATTDRRDLASALTWVAQALPKRMQVPGANGIRVVAQDDTITLSAFDYEVGHTASVAAVVTDPGTALVPGGFLRDVVGAMRGDSLDVVLDDERLTVSVGRSSYGVQCLKPEDALPLPEFPAVVGSLDAAGLRYLVEVTHHLIDESVNAEGILGIQLEASDGVLNAVGLRTTAMATARASWNGQDFEGRSRAKSVVTAVKGLTGDVEIGREGGLLGFRDADRAVTLRTYDSDFAKWRQLLRPVEDEDLVVETRTDDLLAALKLAGGVVEDGRAVRLLIEPDSIEVKADADESGAGTDVLDAEVTQSAEDFTSREVWLRPRLVTDVISTFASERVSLGFSTRGQAVALRPCAHSRAEGVVMPHRTRGES